MSLRSLLVVPFVLHIFVAVVIVGYLSLKNCQDTVDQLANQLTDKVSHAIERHLDSYVKTPLQINQLNNDAIASGSLNIDNAEHQLLQQMQIFDASKISYKLTTDEFVEVKRLSTGEITVTTTQANNKNKFYTYKTDSQGNNRQLIQVNKYKPNLEIDAVKNSQPNWSQIYPSKELGNPNILVSANSPIYDRNRQIVGVTSSELALENISKFLRDLEISKSGKVFIIERDGSLVASSSNEKLITSSQRINALNSSDRTIQATAAYIHQKFGDFSAITASQKVEFEREHDLQVVRVEPWRDRYGLDWLVVVVVPENDFMAQVHANAQVIIVLGLVALFTSTSLGLTISRWIIRPIHRLSAASQAIASGNLDQNVKVKSVNELGVLSQSFNRMAWQLKESFEQLETRVEQRTIELNQSKQLAEAANRAKSEFLANMSHELRTPLNAILGFAQIMNRDSSFPPQQQENLGIINRSGEHLLSLINDVLDMSKIEAGRIVLTENAFDLYDLLNTIYEMFKLKAAAKGLQLEIECDANLPQYVYTDESKLRQILLNLLSNAIKFTDAGKVNLHVQGKKGSDRHYTLSFAVEDTGHGIAQQELTSLFEPFVQTETGRNSGQGTGLGLPISRKFVQLMGGDITVSSTLGKGTIFRFDTQVETVPAIESKSTPTQQVIGLEPGQSEYRILVVDDRYENRRLLTKLLTPIGFQVREAENGRDAIALWQSWEPHLIWMDMRMPVMNGYEATKQIKSHLQGQATAILALTASILEEEKAIVLAAGCDDFVRKPFREEVIWEKMAQYLGVRYIYAQKAEISTQPVSELILEPSSLEVMSSEWIEKLHYAANQLDAEQILELIAQIPKTYNTLAAALRQKVNDFDFDQIVHLTACIPSV
ncbi:histidine kinase [Aliterella atlantica CENA595]|uniref:Circadian input-output histidine kinase CikA n=1 Tax=Aliterella atlantica CENA595 TaxID=1618023 RepID=A0A0D8ZSJ4_9CYAN|nr:histidine kinase [Aliterella atlantica CENA595]